MFNLKHIEDIESAKILRKIIVWLWNFELFLIPFFPSEISKLSLWHLLLILSEKIINRKAKW